MFIVFSFFLLWVWLSVWVQFIDWKIFCKTTYLCQAGRYIPLSHSDKNRLFLFSALKKALCIYHIWLTALSNTFGLYWGQTFVEGTKPPCWNWEIKQRLSLGTQHWWLQIDMWWCYIFLHLMQVMLYNTLTDSLSKVVKCKIRCRGT